MVNFGLNCQELLCIMQRSWPHEILWSIPQFHIILKSYFWFSIHVIHSDWSRVKSSRDQRSNRGPVSPRRNWKIYIISSNGFPVIPPTTFHPSFSTPWRAFTSNKKLMNSRWRGGAKNARPLNKFFFSRDKIDRFEGIDRCSTLSFNMLLD